MLEHSAGGHGSGLDGLDGAGFSEALAVACAKSGIVMVQRDMF